MVGDQLQSPQQLDRDVRARLEFPPGGVAPAGMTAFSTATLVTPTSGSCHVMSHDPLGKANC